MSRPSAEMARGDEPNPATERPEHGPSVEGAAPDPAPQAGQVRRRHVFYLSGFDPKGPAHYHRLYAEQAPLAAAVGGYQVKVGRRRKLGEHGAGWTVDFHGPAETGAPPVTPPAAPPGTPPGAPPDAPQDPPPEAPPDRPPETPPGEGLAGPVTVATEVEFLRWDDVVRDHWPRNPAVLAWDLWVTTVLYLRSGALWRMFRLAWPPVVALVTPFLVLLGLLLALPLGALAGWLAGLALLDPPHTGLPLAVLAGMGTTLLVWGLAFGAARWAEQRLNMQWLLRSYAFTGRQGTHGWPALEKRLDVFADRIVQRVLQATTPPATSGQAQGPDPCDEVLVVAHSSGSIMAVAALARALAACPDLSQRGCTVSLLTLGHWLPLLSSLPSAHGFRQELARLAADPGLDWVDFTAPPDGCCFALIDPIAGAGLAVSRNNHPRLLSPRFAALFSPAAYAEVRRDRFRLHFQYLMASELPGDYDYTRITAGPLSLGRRFASQPSVDNFRQFRLFG